MKNLGVEKTEITNFKGNVEWLVYLPYISTYFFCCVWLLRLNSYVGNIYNWRIEDHVVLVVYELIFGRRVIIFNFQICTCVFFTNQSHSFQ
jgi:hypothetical protein